MRRHGEDRLTVVVPPAEPVVSLGGDLDGANGARIVGADRERHFPDILRQNTGQDQYIIRTMLRTLVALNPQPLATLRKRQLLSQRALAARAGVALSTVYLLEAGKTERATFKVMRAISEALGVPAEQVAEFRRVIESQG